MWWRLEEYSRPAKLDDVERRRAAGATVLGGGTRLFGSLEWPRRVVDLGGCGLSYARTMTLGATLRLEDLVEHGGFLAEAARATYASPLLRALATVAGEAATPGSPFAAALTVLGARQVGDGIVREIALPLGGGREGAVIETVRTLPSAPPIALAAAWVRLDGDRVTERRVAPEGSPDVLVRRALARAEQRARAGDMPVAPFERRSTFLAAPWTGGDVILTLNGERRAFQPRPWETLLHLLRGARLWSVKRGCETGDCGACAAIVDGRPVPTCILPAPAAHGATVETVEALGTPDRLHALQEAFIDLGAIQCGYCTPAMLLCAKTLLARCPKPTEAEVRDALGGVLCRCTGYVKPVQAILEAARRG